MTGWPVIDQQNFLTDWPTKPILTNQENIRLNTPFWDYECDNWTILSFFVYSYSLLMCLHSMYLPFILTAMILNMMKFLCLVENDLISMSLRRIYLTGHMAGQPVNSVNWLVKPRSSQCCQYLTLLVIWQHCQVVSSAVKKGSKHNRQWMIIYGSDWKI